MKKMDKKVCIFTFIVFISMLIFSNFGMACDKINLNTATAEEIAKALDRVGAQYAQRIVEYRKANGPFSTPEDVMKVKGIGTKIFELNKACIDVTTETSQKKK
jgi:competence protein ComEA